MVSRGICRPPVRAGEFCITSSKAHVNGVRLRENLGETAPVQSALTAACKAHEQVLAGSEIRDVHHFLCLRISCALAIAISITCCRLLRFASLAARSKRALVLSSTCNRMFVMALIVDHVLINVKLFCAEKSRRRILTRPASCVCLSLVLCLTVRFRPSFQPECIASARFAPSVDPVV